MIDAEAWWQNESSTIGPGGLTVDGVPLRDVAAEVGTPAYVYSPATVRRNLIALQGALGSAAPRATVFYAMKSNRHPSVLAAARAVPGVGLDVCSPRELARAADAGFSPPEISFNAGMLSDRDLDAVAASGCRVTLDSRSALRRFGARAPGAAVALRFDPGVRASYGQSAKMAYGRAKFGFDASDVDDVVAFARSCGLTPDGVHAHVGWGLQEDAAPAFEAAMATLASVARRVPGLERVNVGGGLGARYVATDRPLPVERWADSVRTHLGPLDVAVHTEPGTLIVASAGVLLVEVNTVERRRGVLWVGVDAGFAVNLNPAHYGIPLTVLRVADPTAPRTIRATLCGNLNEATDVWGHDLDLPEVHEGDLLALLPAGAYGASMASDHCLRGGAAEVDLAGFRA